MEDLKLECLLDSTKTVLEKIIQDDYMQNFVLVGGSALALHLCHRLSEDLDFFTYEDSFDIKQIKKIINRFKNKTIVNISNEQIDLYLDGVKVTFFNAKWKFLKPKKLQMLNVASKEQIAIMKTNTLFLRAKYRDYYDLYFLANHYKLRDIFNFSKEILDGINLKLFVSALTFIDDIEDENIDYLKPSKKLTLKDIKLSFEKKIKKEFIS